ncbi:hypothetical protein Y5S_00055 [Alcanivorax nanhaiticus]|uniref:Co-chaperone DjlA N-terminal domain-containing protein n=1 Tax=Alcanivorax nanhaiticus TaxID=1177154 RepID=A0A095TVG6_9GAMM|nr:hypothetical protein [Alcanivorax nanhaiticus]KGD66388.1 hypothetical protein Y5S_00055 [Alcanivorax nanhaiticus]
MESRDYLEMTFRSINCFSDDGKLDVNELDSLVEIAMRDGEIDDNEKRVLRNIIDRLTDAELTDDMQVRVQSLQEQHGI